MPTASPSRYSTVSQLDRGTGGVFEIRALSFPGRGKVAGYFYTECKKRAVKSAASLTAR
jgi:hypothetical protein